MSFDLAVTSPSALKPALQLTKVQAKFLLLLRRDVLVPEEDHRSLCDK
jgi:hypothetical protein